MRPTTRKAIVIAHGLAAMAFLSAGAASANPVCYADTDHEPTRIVLDVKLHSKLDKFGKQKVYEADGKHAYTEGDYPKQPRMAVFDGAIVTSSNRYWPTGAHLGGTSYFVRFGSGHGPKGGQPYSIDWDCTTYEVSATPREWKCNIHSQNFGFLNATLKKVYGYDPACDVFQDTVDYPAPPK